MNIGIYIYDQAEVLDFSGPFEVFSTASRVCTNAEPFNPILISETGNTISARAGYSVNPHYGFHNHPALDCLIVVGGVHHVEMEKAQVTEWISQQAHTLTLLASVCTGAFLLAKAGLLNGKRVTTHWEDIPALQKQFPALELVDQVRWVDQDDVITSAGITAGIDMSLHMVSKLHSVALAHKTARQMDFAWHNNAAP